MKFPYAIFGLQSGVMLQLEPSHRLGMVLFVVWRILVTLLFAAALYLCITWSRSELNSPILKLFSVGLLALILLYARACLLNNWASNLDKRINSRTFRGFYLETFLVFSVAIFTATVFTTLILNTDELKQTIIKHQSDRLELLKIRNDKHVEKELIRKREILSAIQEFEYRLSGGELPINENKFKLRRKALIVGNSDYKFVERLTGVANDINPINRVLTDAGYQVTLIRDQSREETERGVSKFADGVTEQDIVILYIAGHGYSLAGKNMLADISFDGEKTRIDRGHHIESWFDKVLNRKPKFSFFVLDACREIAQEMNYIKKIEEERNRLSFDPIILKTYTPSTRVPYIILQSARAGQYANDAIGDCVTGKSCSEENRMSPFASEFSSNFRIDTPLNVMIKNIEKGLSERISAIRTNPPPDLVGQQISDQDIEVRSSSGGLVIRHIAPESKLAARREKLQDNVLFEELKRCKEAGAKTLSCLERERERLKVEVSFIEKNISEISALNSAALSYAIKNSGDLSVVIRESARSIAFLPLMLLMTLILGLDMVMLYIGFRIKRSQKAKNESSSSTPHKLKNIVRFAYNALLDYRIEFSKLRTRQRFVR